LTLLPHLTNRAVIFDKTSFPSLYFSNLKEKRKITRFSKYSQNTKYQKTTRGGLLVFFGKNKSLKR
jgi:hypothetical protein